MTGQVLGYASSKDAIAFQDVRQFSSNLLMVSIAPLVPSTTYTFSVCAVFDVGAGAEVGAVSTLTGVTAEPVGGTNQHKCKSYCRFNNSSCYFFSLHFSFSHREVGPFPSSS